MKIIGFIIIYTLIFSNKIFHIDQKQIYTNVNAAKFLLI